MDLIEARGAGGPEVLHAARGAVPQPARQEVLIRVRAAGVNRPDVLQRLGRYPVPADASPIIGLEVAGEVAALGPEAQGFAIGDQVCALTNGGGYAQYCRAPQGQVLPWPKGYDAVRSAALPETFFTVWANAFQMGRLHAGETVLIHGGTSGIGTTALQLAREFGARVFVTVGSAAKAEACLKLGAEVAINYREQAFEAVVSERTGGRGVDVVVDIIGAKYFDQNLAALGKDGRLVIIGTMGGNMVEKFNLGKVQAKRLSIMGSTMRPRSSAEKAAIAVDLRAKVWPVLDAGRCAPLVHQVLPLAQAAEAHRLMESSDHIGKIVLKVD
ncbi:MAG TPA: NAD(P)H-quinone oxidoreductase [Acetobacteraceae bacterium]|nr:NAD(P)H-quinone oxidoreductase [Acetobacteraceae bacterium]